MTIAEPNGPPPHESQESESEATSSNRADVPPGMNTNDGPRALEDVVGVDMIRIKFPIADPRPVDHHAEMKWSYRFTVAGVPVFLWIYLTSGEWYASLRFNPSKHRLNPRVWGGLPIDLLPTVLQAVWWEAQNYVNPLVALREARVSRLDACRDFLISDGPRSAILSGAIKVPVRYATRRSLWSNSRGIPKTVYASTRHQGCVRGYDHADRHGTSPLGTFRVEAQGHRDWLARADIKVVADLGPSTIASFFEERFDWSGLGVPVVYEHSRTERLWNLAMDPASGLSRLQVVRLLGRERLIEAGIDPSEGNDTSALRRALRLTAGVPHLDPAVPEIIRLDPRFDRPVRTIAA